jgi:hypothetical protein
MEKEYIVDKVLTPRLKKIFWSDRKGIPLVCIMSAPNYGKFHLAVHKVYRNRMPIIGQLTEMLYQDEINVKLSYAYSYSAKSHGLVWS